MLPHQELGRSMSKASLFTVSKIHILFRKQPMESCIFWSLKPVLTSNALEGTMARAQSHLGLLLLS